MNLNSPAIDARPLTAADLAQTRKHSTGTVYHLHRATVCPPCSGNCDQGDKCPARACATEGGTHADPVDTGLVSMRRHRDIRETVLLLLAFVALGAAARYFWPLVA